MKRRDRPEVRRCCNGSETVRGRASQNTFLKGEIKMSNKKVVKEEQTKKNTGHGPGGGTWGVKGVGKVANKYPPKWGQKGMKSNSNSGGSE